MRRLWSSFRVRLLAGTVLWTVGLLYFAHMASVLLILGHGAFAGRPSIAGGLPLALVCITAGFLIVRRALRPFAALRERLMDVHQGREPRVHGAYLSEVQPLVDDLNALLDHRDRRVREALSKAGDLAHGLKTPLAVIGHEAERAAARGHADFADAVTSQVERMRRHIDYHLAHARAAASGATPGAHCSVAESAASVARTLERLYAERGITIEVAVSPRHMVRGHREDLEEMLGNLLDNACKWAHSQVALSSADGNDRIVIDIEDDGPGIAPELRDAVLHRGVRADQAAPGSGFGLAIVRDLAALYGGSVALDASHLGGTRARLTLPAASGVQAPFSRVDA